MNPENQNNEEKKSLLSDIIEESKKESNTTAIGNPTEPPITTEQPKKIREPIPASTIMKAIFALFFTSVIFLAIGLAYIIFNPDEAQIFVRMFDIDIPRLKTWLSTLVNGSFGILSLGFSIALFISIFRAIWTPREQKRKKTIAVFIWILIGIFLLTIFSFWMFLVQKIGTTIWDGWIIGVYDNTLYANERWRSFATLTNTQDLIWPITIRYDIRGNARVIQNNWGFSIESYQIDFDGARCSNGSSIVSWNNAEDEENIICTFDTIKTYNIRGTYLWKDIQWKPKTIDIELSPVEIGWLVTIEETKNALWKDIVTLDAKSLGLIGEAKWTYENGKTINTTTIFHEPTDTPLFVALNVGDMTERVFVIQKKQSKIGNPIINIIPLPSDSQNITFALTWLTIDYNSILKIDWVVNNGTVICPNGRDTCNYKFNEYGNIKIKAIITTIDKTSHTIENEFIINKPLRLIRHAQVRDKSGKLLNPESTYDPISKTYIIKDILPPEELIFDARDIVLENTWYKVTDVRWVFSDGKNSTEKLGTQVNFNITNSYRYTVSWIYTFEKAIAWSASETSTVTDAFVVDVEYKNLVPQIAIVKQTSDYVPSSITVDGSQSWSENNEIIKFIYNFWEWKIDSVGDAIQTYEYKTPGEKTITLTVIDDTWAQAQVKKTIVLKEAPRTISFVPSISPWIVWLPIDFSANIWWGTLEWYLWSFGDNTASQRWETVTHIFTKPWEYKVTLTATYADGTQQQTTSTYRVTLWEE
jgi:PKD repeat protein